VSPTRAFGGGLVFREKAPEARVVVGEERIITACRAVYELRMPSDHFAILVRR